MSRQGQKFFTKMVIKSMLYKKSRIFAMFLSSVLASFSFFALFSLYFELPKKFNQAFRHYGANVVFFPKDNNNFTKQDLQTITNYFSKNEVVSSSFYSYINIEINLQNAIAIATNIQDAYKTNPFWNIEGKLPSKKNQILIGKNLASIFFLDIGDKIDIKFKVNDEKVIKKSFEISGILETGKSEESFVFVDYDYISSFFDNKLDINTIEVSVAQGEKELLREIDEFNKKHKKITSNPIKSITDSEYKVFNKLKHLIFIVNAFILSIIGVAIFTIMVSTVKEKREEIAIKKAIGASNKYIFLEFIMMSVVVSFLSNIIGVAFGQLFAQGASLRIFSSKIAFNFELAVLSLIVNITLTLVSCCIPVDKITKIQVAKTLKGE